MVKHGTLATQESGRRALERSRPCGQTMTANESRKDAGKKASSDDSTAIELQTDSGVSRRRFLGATAALGAFPGVASGTPARDIKQDSAYGSRKASLPKHNGVSSSIEIAEAFDGDASLSANSYWYDDQESQVGFRLDSESATVALALSPDRAREFAGDLQLAAHHAEYGEAEASADSIEADLTLSELIEFHEQIDWGSIPSITATEASAWTARLTEARDAVREGL